MATQNQEDIFATQKRRQFLERCFGTSCGFAATLLMAPLAARRAYGQQAMGDVVGKQPFGRIERSRMESGRSFQLRLPPREPLAILVRTATAD